MSAVLRLLDSERLTAWRLSRLNIAVQSAAAGGTAVWYADHGGWLSLVIALFCGSGAALDLLQASLGERRHRG